jgi:hypothetical protein
VVARKKTQDGREALEVEGLIQEGLQKTVFYFKLGILIGVELQYQSETWPEEKYNSLMGDLQRRISERYGPPKEGLKQKLGNAISSVKSSDIKTIYEWRVKASSMQLLRIASLGADKKKSFCVILDYIAY